MCFLDFLEEHELFEIFLSIFEVIKSFLSHNGNVYTVGVGSTYKMAHLHTPVAFLDLDNSARKKLPEKHYSDKKIVRKKFIEKAKNVYQKWYSITTYLTILARNTRRGRLLKIKNARRNICIPPLYGSLFLPV